MRRSESAMSKPRSILPAALMGAILLEAGCSRPIHQDGSLAFVKRIGPVFPPAGGCQVAHVFHVGNPSKTQPMRLDLVRKSCTCLDYAVEPKVVGPSSTTRVTISVHVSRHTKVIDAWAVFRTHLDDFPELDLRLVVEAFAPLTIKPAEFPYYEIAPGKEEVIGFEAISCQPCDDEPAEPKVKAGTEGLQVKVLSRRQIVAGGVRTVVMRCQARIKCPEQVYEQTLQEHTIVLRRGTEQVSRRILWAAQPPIQVVPKQVFLCGPAGKSQTCELLLQHTNPFSIVGAYAGVSEVAVRTTLHQNRSNHAVRVCVSPPPSGARALACTITLTTDLVEQPKVSIPLYVLWRKDAPPASEPSEQRSNK